MALPIEQQALQYVWTAQERAIVNARATDNDVIAAACAGVAAVDHEFVGAQATVARVFVERARDVDALAPAGCGLDVDFDDAGIGRDANDCGSWIERRLVAFDTHRRSRVRGAGFDGGKQFKIIFERIGGWHEDVQHALARFDDDRRAHVFFMRRAGLNTRRLGLSECGGECSAGWQCIARFGGIALGCVGIVLWRDRRQRA